MHSIDFKSWQGFVSGFRDKLNNAFNVKHRNDLIFRGQRSPSWDLISSFDRIEKDKRKFERLVREFADTCKFYSYNLELFGGDYDFNSAASYAQHYGLPTRLLDWTKSPFISAFFAISSDVQIKEKSFKIWVLNTKSELLHKNSTSIKFLNDIDHRYNYRVKNQLGVFTLCEFSEDSITQFENSLLKRHGGLDDLLCECTIHFDSMEEVMSDLYDMGITFSTVYPDMTGYMLEARYRVGML